MRLQGSKDHMVRRILMMIIGIALLAVGIGLFKISLMGNDPSTAMVIAMGERIGVDFSLVLIVMNCLWFVVEAVFDRRLIGVGTFVNGFGVGPIASVFEKAVTARFGSPASPLAQWLIMGAGILVLTFSAALYQTADLGIAPYDALSLVLSRKTGWKYFWCRILTDTVCVAVALILGGLIGLGTLVCALGLGPFIAFFTRHAAEKILHGGK